jgi:hypothetical protein
MDGRRPHTPDEGRKYDIDIQDIDLSWLANYSNYLWLLIPLFIFGFLYNYGFGNAMDDTKQFVGLRDRNALWNDLPVRNCMITETLCSGKQHCRGASGDLIGPSAITPNKTDICCLFSCETDVIPVRQCIFPEKTCSKGSSCRMGQEKKQVVAIGPAGESCCEFDCDLGDQLPSVSACFVSDTLCAADSLCYGINDNVIGPKSKTATGVCCGYNRNKDSVCTKPFV